MPQGLSHKSSHGLEEESRLSKSVNNTSDKYSVTASDERLLRGRDQPADHEITEADTATAAFTEANVQIMQ